MHIVKKTKVVATIGPATTSESKLKKMLEAGVNVARLNFSHGDFDEHQARLDMIRKVSTAIEKPISILQDLGGPKIRLGDFEAGFVTLKKGSEFVLTSKKILGTETKSYITYKTLPQEVKKGTIILLNDGKQSLKVLSTTKTEVKCKVLVGGEMKNRRGVNIPRVTLKHIDALTPKDKKDLEFGLKNNVDFFALSFVRFASDITKLRKILQKNGSKAHIISKIETTQAVENIDEIIEETDAIMVARGDLAVEIPAEDVPLFQKQVIKKCRRLGKPVIVATQVLASMTDSPRPTRAEVSDVANAILDGTDAVMLSEESAMGKYPIEAVQVMTSVAQKTENIFPYRELDIDKARIVNAVSHTAVEIANEIDAKVIVTLTESGLTPRSIARFKPSQPIISLTSQDTTVGQLALSYGCYTAKVSPIKSLSSALMIAENVLKKEKLLKKGEKFVLAAGIPFGYEGGTNMVIAHTLG